MRLGLSTIVALAAALGGALGCHGEPPLGEADATGRAGATGAAGAPDGGQAGAAGGAGARADAGTADGGGADGGMPETFDPGSVGIRLLSNTEYARTIQDLLGLSGLDAQIISTFPGRSGGYADVFDNGPGATIPTGSYSIYFQNAVSLVARAFASDVLRARVVTCAPAAPTDDTCARDILRAFGLRAWRRPLADDELAALVAIVRTNLTAGAAFADAIEEAVVALVASESFLYRIELDPAADTRAHPLTSYELASRLSYLLWSTMPDDTLLGLAADGTLGQPAVLTAQVSRMLGDPRADGLVRDFFGQWLFFRDLEDSRLVVASPDWSPAFQAAMGEEARLTVSLLLQSPDRGLGDLLTRDINFVNAQLAYIYGFSFTTPAFTFVEVANTNDARVGYLGMAAFLAPLSFADHSDPVYRGRWILMNLLCQDVPDPPPGEPPVPATGTARQQSNDRVANPTCAPCHSTIDPVGLGLESFDQLGRFRTTYPLGEPVDDHGALGATPYQGEPALAALVAKDPRFAACARSKLLSYALGRTPTATDAAHVAAIDAAWSAAGQSARGLLAAVILDDLFRYRRGEGP